MKKTRELTSLTDAEEVLIINFLCFLGFWFFFKIILAHTRRCDPSVRQGSGESMLLVAVMRNTFWKLLTENQSVSSLALLCQIHSDMHLGLLSQKNMPEKMSPYAVKPGLTVEPVRTSYKGLAGERCRKGTETVWLFFIKIPSNWLFCLELYLLEGSGFS